MSGKLKQIEFLADPITTVTTISASVSGETLIVQILNAYLLADTITPQ